MIAIVNKGGDKDGICIYSLQINNKVIAHFEHDRTDGLDICLRKAADAYVKQNEVNVMEYYLGTIKGSK